MRKALFSFCVLAAACGGGDKGLDTPDECNPLGGLRCMTPWPSAIYEKDDASSPTGRRIALPQGSLPTNIDGIAIKVDSYNQKDGFSPAGAILTAFPNGVDPSNLGNYKNYAKSLTADSPTVLIDMSTGELVEHFAEVDSRVPDLLGSQALYIRPSKMLKGSTRYAVAIKKTLKATGGGELPIPEGFQAILDDSKTSHPLLERVRPRYTEIFAALAAKGIQKTDLVTAWDFTTGSRDAVRADLVNSVAAAMPMMGTNGSSLTFTQTETMQNDTRIAKRYDGLYDVPLFLTNDGSTALSTKMQRTADGKPSATKLYKVPYTAIIPTCALTATAPVPIMIYGHGLLGDSTQTASGGTRTAAAELCFVAIGTDMRGMSDVDVPNVVSTLNDVNNHPSIFDAMIQGMVNHVALVQVARGPMAQTLFRKPNGDPLVDPTKVHWYGISQGGIMGTTICAIDPVIEKCVLQVGAINYSMMLERSRDWPTYRTTLIGAYPDPLDTSLIINLMQWDWDRSEPTSVADIILGQGFPGAPKKQVFMQVAIGDDEVANIASEYQARTMGIPVMMPSPYVPYGMQPSTAPSQNAMVLFDFGVSSTIPLTNEPPPDNDVHSNIRNKRATIEMMRKFYAEGVIEQKCTSGTSGCDCAAGACGEQL
ncbi:MAG: hypothetical protein M4D80_30920 [Myxococcota bacterium]|nr:hypothetical protein [Deltaproteobacteria bacterium]MDQ3339601.1 hypothetical protein [Myxococcota bacterium]